MLSVEQIELLPEECPKVDKPYDPEAVRLDFPILDTKAHGKPLVYLDNAATTQKPTAVLDTLEAYYRRDNANIHRGVYELSERATRHYEEARVKVKRFLNARDAHEIVFVRGATEGVNLVASTYGRSNVKAGDEIVVTQMEHHSNIVPWQMLCEEKGAKLRIVPVDDAGALILDELPKLLSERTKLFAVTHMSNALGTINPVDEIVRICHERGVPVLVDGAQSAYHRKIDVQAMDCDFFVFSGHKLYGPTGIGVLYGKRALLEAMPPYQGGGDMILSVTFERTTYNALPHKFEAGTPHIAGAIGLGAAIDYLETLGMNRISAYENELLSYATRRLGAVEGLRIVGTADEKASVISFVLGDIHPHDIGTILDQDGIAIRTGHHCAQPIMTRFGIPATARVSLACYNTKEEIDALIKGLARVRKVFA
jgi:cysteine desulfurase/selenocysteine lyase